MRLITREKVMFVTYCVDHLIIFLNLFLLTIHNTLRTKGNKQSVEEFRIFIVSGPDDILSSDSWILRASVSLCYVPRSWRTKNLVSFQNPEGNTKVSQNYMETVEKIINNASK